MRAAGWVELLGLSDPPWEFTSPQSVETSEEVGKTSRKFNPKDTDVPAAERRVKGCVFSYRLASRLIRASILLVLFVPIEFIRTIHGSSLYLDNRRNTDT